jgi:hypothetical protein
MSFGTVFVQPDGLAARAAVGKLGMSHLDEVEARRHVSLFRERRGISADGDGVRGTPNVRIGDDVNHGITWSDVQMSE